MTLYNNDKIPSTGYTLPLWKQGNQYRATALAYMEREKVNSVYNSITKRHYQKETIKNALIK